MPWYFPWSDSIKKRACRYLLQHYLGHFLKEKLTLDQLSVDLYKGTGTIHDVSLDVASLNEALANYNVPIEIVDGFIGKITVSIPWSALIHENTMLQIQNLEFTIQPKQRDGNAGVMLDSVFSSMTTSIQLAQECLKQEQTEGEQQIHSATPFEGLEMFAQTIEAVLAHVKVELIDTVMRLEHLPREASNGAAVEVHISRIQYFDDLASDLGSTADKQNQSSFEPAAIAHKNFHLMGISMYCDEFPASHRTISRSLLIEASELRPKMGDCMMPPSMLASHTPGQKGETNRLASFPKEKEPIMIALLSGKQELKLKIKQAEELPGPKLELDCQVGSIHVHMSPKQVHLVTKIVNGLMVPGSCDDSNVQANKMTMKPMGKEDYQKIEHDLQHHLQHGRLQQYSTLHPTWQDLEKEHAKLPLDSMHRHFDDTAAEVTKYQLKLSFLSMMVLHENPPDILGDGTKPGKSSADNLRDMAKEFFSQVKGISVPGMGTSLKSVREQFSKICPTDHFSILCKPVSVECQQKISVAMNATDMNMAIGMMELVEVLFNRQTATSSLMGFHLPIENILPEYYEILTFVQEELPAHGSSKQSMYSSLHVAAAPCIRVKLHTFDKLYKDSFQAAPDPKQNVHVELGKCLLEIDVTVIDRVQALIKPHKSPVATGASSIYVSAYKSNHQLTQSLFSQTLDDNKSQSEKQTDIKVTSPQAQIAIRFPVPDLRSDQTSSRPWWQRCLHKEVFLLQVSDADFQTTFCSAESVTQFAFTCTEGHGLFQMDPEEQPISCIRIGKGDGQQQECVSGFDCPRLVIKMYPPVQSALEEMSDTGDDSPPVDSLNGACQFTKPQPSPFSSRKVLYDNKEMVIPGDQQELSDFKEKASGNTCTSLDLTLPNLHVCFPDKNFFELVYNRLCNDMLLWQPASPALLDNQFGTATEGSWSPEFVTRMMQQRHQMQSDVFSMCKSGVQYDSSSESEDGSGDYFSVAQQAQRRNKQRQPRQQSKICFNLEISRGRLTAGCPLKDEEGQVRKDCQGRLALDVEQGCLFTVVNFNGDPDLQYLSVQVNKAALFHNGCTEVQPASEMIDLVPDAMIPPPGLLPTIYLSEPGVTTKLSGQVGRGNNSQDMLSIAVKISQDTFRNVKECQVALAVKGGTLQHKVTAAELGWFHQLVDFFDVTDYPILGYTLPKIVTELHAHLWSCAIDYRPLFLPYRAMICVEAFSISSNVIAESPTSLLRFMIEDGALYVSNKTDVPDVDLKKNYVCVIDLGLFELSLRSSDGVNPKYPKTDLRVSNNIVHIRTCSDSCKALAELVNYFAGDGDLEKSVKQDFREASGKKPMSTQTSSMESSMESGNWQQPQSDMHHVDHKIADAMQEDPGLARMKATAMEKALPMPQMELDEPKEESLVESNMSSLCPDIPVQVMGTMGLVDDIEEYEQDDNSSLAFSQLHKSSNEENGEFCIINNPGLGIAPRDGKPTINLFTNKTIAVVDNHFTMPLDKTDQLKAPESFPLAVFRYTLQEISLVWYIYGGKDFKTTGDSCIASTKLGKVAWQARGGQGRDIDLLVEVQLSKVRLQCETYPETTEQASRQILLVNDVEIRDRLASSKIHKMLYQYTSDAMPKQAHSNMILMKALHIRPDVNLPGQECSVRLSLQPLRLNVDQDTLLFLKSFVSELAGESETSSLRKSSAESEASMSLPANVPANPEPKPASPMPAFAPEDGPVFRVQEESQDLLIMFDEITDAMDNEQGQGLKESQTSSESEEEALSNGQVTFIKSFIFSPEVPIRLDYQGKRVDTEQGTIAGLLMGLAQLNCSELRLKRIHHRHGLLGLNRLLQFIAKEWITDIKNHQLPSILGGVGPMHSLVQLVQGLRDLFWLPVEQYRKDGRIARGIQRGTKSFMQCTAMSALELTNRLVQTVQYCAEVAHDVVSPGLSVKKRRQKQKLLNQPADLREGFTNAYAVVKDGINDTVDTIYKTAVEEHEQKGMSGAVGGVLRQIPPTVIQPVILATEATSNVLGGMRNQLLPDRRKEETEKWKLQREN